MRNIRQQIGDEMWDQCSEYLEMLPEENWEQFLLPVAIKKLLGAYELIEVYKMRLEDKETDKMKVWE